MGFQDLLYTKEDGIATITLNRPEVLNAMTPEMLNGWVTAIEDAKRDEDTKVLVVTGAGRAFCTGADVKAIGTGKWIIGGRELSLAQQRSRIHQSLHAVHRALADFNKPYIASINGPAIGAGMGMASLCDIRIASNRATFGMTYVRLARIPADGSCYFLPRIVGLAKACELIWTGRIFGAEEALRIGYVSQVVPHEELATATQKLATQLAKGPAVALQLAKRLIYQSLYLDMNIALDAAATAQIIAEDTEDAKEGATAWMEKREPVFKGR